MNDRRVLVAPSLLAADFAALGEAIRAAERGGADLIHVDIMDGHFVPNLTMGPPVVRSIRTVTTLPLDVHLMIEDPDRFIEDFVDAGADRIAVHVEALPHLHRTLQLIHSLGKQAGVALNPSTPAVMIEDVIDGLDYVLVMTVNPGFGAQTFIPHSTSKIRAVRALLHREGSRAPIEVDGGIDTDTAPEVVAAGAEILVAGHAIFSRADPAQAVRDLRTAANAVAGP